MGVPGLKRSTPADATPVGVGAFRVGVGPDACFITRGLGSCVGVGILDPEAGVAGLFHAMVAASSDGAQDHFDASRGVDAMINQCIELGARPERMRVCLAGGAIGGRLGVRGIENVVAVRRALSRLGLGIAGSDIGGLGERSLGVCAQEGRIWSMRRGRERALFGG